MGAWGSGVFANDDAMDWIAGLEDTDDLDAVEIALGAVNDEGGYLESPVCSEALAAAEVVAALCRKPGSDVPSEVFEWIARVRPTVSADLQESARGAIDRILAGSELQELWDEAGSPDADEWRAELMDLRGRLD